MMLVVMIELKKTKKTQVFRVKKLVGLPPQLELLADSVTSQVHDNLFKLAHAESIAGHAHSFTHARAHRHEQTVQLSLTFLCSFGAAPNNPAIHT